jgi:hypothetical protein
MAGSSAHVGQFIFIMLLTIHIPFALPMPFSHGCVDTHYDRVCALRLSLASFYGLLVLCAGGDPEQQDGLTRGTGHPTRRRTGKLKLAGGNSVRRLRL